MSIACKLNKEVKNGRQCWIDVVCLAIPVVTLTQQKSWNRWIKEYQKDKNHCVRMWCVCLVSDHSDNNL